MAYCRNCGSEIPEGVKFCTNCGSAVDGYFNEARSNEFNRTNQSDDVISKKNSKKKDKRYETGFEKFSKFFGVILMFIAIVDYNSDPPILTIILSLAIIIGAIFCLSQKYRLKGFTIIALIIAVFCLFAGISQGKKIATTSLCATLVLRLLSLQIRPTQRRCLHSSTTRRQVRRQSRARAVRSSHSC